MASQTFTIPETTCPANQMTATAGIAVPGNLLSVTVTLTSSQWKNAGLAGQKVLWGYALSADGGATWGPGTCDNSGSNTIGGGSASIPARAYTTSIVGTLTRVGGQPFIEESGGTITQVAGEQARLFVWPTATMKLGATITVVS